MVSSLDPHSQYFDKKSYKEFREGTTGKFVGVGIEISQEDGFVKVVSPIEGSPADRAGLKPGDLITKVDDTSMKGLSLNEAVKRMRGEPRTKVLLTIFRKDENRTFPVTIIREEIKTVSVKSKMIENGFGWIRVSQFQERTVDDMVRKLEELYKQDPKMKGLVLDLRNDPGGLLDAAVAISAVFLPDNVTVVSTNGQLEESKYTFKAAPEFTCVAVDKTASLALTAKPVAISKKSPWSFWLTKARHLPAKSSQVLCKTTNAPPSWVAKHLAKGRYKPCVNWGQIPL
jgi:carboxyl-terminal processing protease